MEGGARWQTILRRNLHTSLGCFSKMGQAGNGFRSDTRERTWDYETTTAVGIGALVNKPCDLRMCRNEHLPVK